MNKSSLLIQEPPLQVLPSLAVAIGLNEAIVTQQLHYWLENEKVGVVRDGHKWVFNTYDEWQENFPFWSLSTIKRVFSDLEKRGIVIAAQLDAKRHDMTKFYRIDYGQLELLDEVKLTQSKSSHRAAVNKNTEKVLPDGTQRLEPGAQPAPNAAGLSLENQIYLGVDEVVLPEKTEFDIARATDIANLIDMQCSGGGALALAFMKAREIIFSESKVKGQRKAAKEMLEQGVKPEHVTAAVEALIADNLVCVDLFAVIKTAVGLANPAPVSSGERVAAESY